MIKDIEGKFCYETHLHTKEASACASASAEEQVRFCKEMGYTGIVITNHFFNGNTGIPRELPWEERVELFCEPYEAALAEGKKVGLDVFFGWEYCYNGSEIVTYGLDKEWLLAHPESETLGINDYAALAHESGAFLIHVHPMREDWYIPYIRLYPRVVDAAEIFNASRPDDENNRNAAYAAMYNLPPTAGSDNHHAYKSKRLGGVCTPKKCESVMELAEFIKNRQVELAEIEVKK